ncbi:MAG: hypothetical protein H0X41_02280, partial [Chitinophagaceae bacterium]|nr:hypothetical protein [Chitinophagaceae bacterium]
MYLIKVIACSAMLYAYYRLYLYNKTFHQWNRFYLLFSTLISLVIPFLQVKVFPAASSRSPQPVTELLKTAFNNSFHEYEGVSALPNNAVPNGLMIIYAIGCAIMLTGLLHAIGRLHRLIKRSGFRQLNGFRLVGTNEKDAPFSFFRYIFWNNTIDLSSEHGQYILQHERIHVQQWHSVDKMLINILMIPFWCNPFFWLIRRELGAVHEFIADGKTIPDADPSLFSAVVLSTAYPSIQFSLTSHFNLSPVKRRLLMLSQIKQSRNNYCSRLLVLPVLFGLLAAFSFTHRNGKAI